MKYKYYLITALVCFLICYNITFFEVDNVFIKPNEIEISYIEPIKISKLSEEHYIYDFGKSSFGNIDILLKKKCLDTLNFYLGEQLNENGFIERYPKGSIRIQNKTFLSKGINKAEQLSLVKDILNTGRDAIKAHASVGVVLPFRYCEIQNLKIPLSDIVIRQKVYNSRFNDSASYFTSSDTILNKVWDISKHTIKATSFLGIYIDGDRERIPYEADAYINMLSHFSLDTNYTLAKRSCEYFITNPSWPTEWVLHTVPLFYEYYMYSGDIYTLKNNYKNLKNKTLISLAREDGLISSNSNLLNKTILKEMGFANKKVHFKSLYSDIKSKIKDFIKPEKKILIDIIDWPNPIINTETNGAGEIDNYDLKDYNTVVNSFHYYNLVLMSKLAGYLGEKKDSIFFQRRSIILKENFNHIFINKNKGIYVDGENSTHSSLHANMFPLAFDLVPKENLKTVIEFIKTKGMACSPYGAQHLLTGLFKYNQSKIGLSLLTSKNKRSWWNMIETGSTMTTEAWDIDYKLNMDWSHPWGASPVNIIVKGLWGINPLKPGMKSVLIYPQLNKLNFSKIKIPTNLGQISGSYIKKSNILYYEINLPSKLNAVFKVNKSIYNRIVINNEDMKSNSDVFKLKNGYNNIKLIK